MSHIRANSNVILDLGPRVVAWLTLDARLFENNRQWSESRTAGVPALRSTAGLQSKLLSAGVLEAVMRDRAAPHLQTASARSEGQAGSAAKPEDTP